MLKAPYNFVPINHKVVPAYWGDFVSHDVPFDDGLSGKVQVIVQTHSPLFIRDGAKEKEENETQQFSSFDGKYFIPGSSIKGMLRNVLEILSFSKMDRVNDHRFAIRDLSAAEVYRERIKNDEIKGGWLRKNTDGTYTIRDCGTPGRISHRHLDEIYGTSFSTYFLKRSNGGFFNPQKEEEKAAQFKYKKFGTRSRDNTFVFEFEDVMRDIYHVTTETVNGMREGRIVFTGQPSPRFSKSVFNRKTGESKEKWFGHHLEFIFFEDEGNEIIVDETVMTDFFFAYHDHDKNRWSIDWTHWRELLHDGEAIPVFFRKKIEKENGISVEKIRDLGLSYMYKLPYEYSVKDAIPHSNSQEIDLSEAIFGFTKEDGGNQDMNALKGRVHIGHAFALNDVEVMLPVSEVLSGPKASYYPNYIRQNNRERYNTFWDKHAEIAGWKRYPIHKNGVKNNPASSDVRNPSKIETAFVPIKEGAVFSFQLAYHNLRKVELGALLSAMSFHNTPNTFHSLGMAKPLGYGKVTLEVIGLDEKEDYIKSFEAFMRASDTGQDVWHDTIQIQELITMAKDQDNNGSSELAYMELKEFPVAKKNGESLNMYSKLKNIQAGQINALATNEEVEAAQHKIAKERNLFASKLQPSSALERIEEETRAKFEEAIAKKKEFLLQQLSDRKRKLQLEESTRRKKEAKQKAEAGAPDWSHVNIKDGKRGFDSLKKVIREYGEKLHVQKESDLLANFPNGYLPERHLPNIEEIILSLYQEGSKKDKKNWCKPYSSNALMKKIAEWIGEKAAKDLLKTLCEIQ